MLEMAEAWGIPPWKVEEELTKEWWDRFMTHRKLKAEGEDHRMKMAKEKARH